MYFLKPSYVLHSNFMSSLNVYVDLKLNILLVSFSIFISLLFTFMRVTIWIRSYFSSCFIFCERKTSFGFCEFCLILCWFFSGREMMTWYHWDRKPCSWSRPGRWVCHVINFVGVSTISDDITLKISNPLFTQADFCTVFISIAAKFDGVFHLQAVDQ